MVTPHDPGPGTALLFGTLRGERRGTVGRNVLAGLTAGAVVIPQAMAYASIAQLPAQVGLFTCVAPMIVYAALGGSKAMSVSTTSTIATLTATTLVTSGVAAGGDEAIPHLVALTMLVAVILFLARLLRLASLVENISLATMTGIKVGVGITVAASQVPKLIGVDDSGLGGGFFGTVRAIVASLPEADAATTLFSLATIVVLVLLRHFLPAIPAPLIATVGGIVLIATGAAWTSTIATIPDVPRGLPPLALPDFGHLGAMVPGALAIAIMAFLETVSVARGIRTRGDPVIDSDRELLAIGAATLAGAVLQTMPPAGGFSQSAVNLRAGARSQLAALTTAALAVLVAFVLAPLLSLLPEATLGCLVFIATIGLVDIAGLRRLARINRLEFWIALATAVIGLCLGLIAAVATGVFLTLGLVLHELNRPRVEARPWPPGTTGSDSAMLVVIQTPLYTANVFATQRAVLALAGESGWPALLLLDVSRLRIVSVTVLDALRDLDEELAGHGVRLELLGMQRDPARVASRTSWWRELVAAGRVHAAPGASDNPRENGSET